MIYIGSTRRPNFLFDAAPKFAIAKRISLAKFTRFPIKVFAFHLKHHNALPLQANPLCFTMEMYVLAVASFTLLLNSKRVLLWTNTTYFLSHPSTVDITLKSLH